MFKETGQNFESQTKHSSIDSVREKVAGIVNESRMPAKDYESTVGIYGGQIKYNKEGKMVFDMQGIVSKADRFGDAVLRTYDEHTMRQPLEMLKKHPKLFFAFIKAGTKRYRGSPEEISEHINELGLGKYYGLHADGIEIKKPELFTDGIALQDIYRADEIASEKLNDIDRFQALASASQYARQVHKTGHGAGELLSSDIIFEHKNEDGTVENPVLNIPDIVYNKDIKQKVETYQQDDEAMARDQKATDMLDFMFQIGVEELRRSEDWSQVERALETIIENYDDKDVIEWVRSFSKRGRLTLVGDKEVLDEAKKGDAMAQKTDKVLSQHNKARLNTQTDIEGKLRQAVIAACDKYLDQENNKSSS